MAGSYDGSLKFDTAIDENGFNSGITKLGGLAKGGLKVLAAAVAGVATAFGAVTKASLDSVASLEQNIGGVETLFKDSAQAVIENANNAYKTAGVSANKYMETVTSFSASLLQGLGGDTAEAARIADMAMVDMSDNANKFGTNMEDIQNAYQGFAKQNYTMLDNLKLGYGGTQSEMIRLINDSGILNENIEDLDNVSFAQMIQAIHKIQEDMGIAGTTSEEALTTIEGSVGAAKAAFDNFLNGSGSPQALAETVITAGRNITDNLMEIIPRLAEELPQVGSLLMDSLSDSLDSGKLNELMVVGGQIVSNLTTGIISALPGLVTAAAQIISSFTENIGSSIPQLLSSGGAIIEAILIGMLQVLPAIGAFAIQLVTELYNQLTAHGPELLQNCYDENELIRRIQKGDESALAIIISEYHSYVVKIVYSILGSYSHKIDLKGVVNQIFFTLWHKANKIDLSKSVTIKGYLGTLARNTAINEKKKCIPDYQINDEIIADISDDFNQVELRLLLVDALRKLNKDEQLILVLFYFQNEKIADISCITGIPASTVKSKLKRCKEKMKKILEEGGNQYENFV